MRIGFFTDTYFPINFGTEIAIDTFRKKLEELGEEVFIFAPRFPGHKDVSEKIFRFPSIKVQKSPEARLLFFGPRAVSRIASLKLDICHSHTPFTAGWLAKAAARRLAVPAINQYHILYPEYAKTWLWKNNRIAAKAMTSYTRFFLNKHAAVIAPSPKIKKLLESYGVKRPIRVLPTGLDLQKFKSAEKDSAWAEKRGIGPEDEVLIYVGRQTAEKNVLFLAEAFGLVAAKKPRAKLMLVGEGPLKPEIEKIAQKKNFGDRLIFTGRIPREETMQAYLASKIFLFASKTDTQGLVIMEAAALGLPVVALKDEAYVGMLENNQNGYTVFEEKPEAFAGAILKILDDRELWRKFSDNSKKIAENFSDINQAKKLLEIYRQIS
jgi:glycosyltransferase involved in cell wall biosynthesis